MIFPTHRPRVLVVFSFIALLIPLVIAAIAYADQRQRIRDPEQYAERRCVASFGTTQPSEEQLAACVDREKAKSTLSSILPLFVVGIVVFMVAIVGIVVGRKDVRREEERMRRLRGQTEP